MHWAVLPVVGNLVVVVADVAGVGLGRLFICKLFLDSFVRVDCIDRSCRFYVAACNHFLDSFARLDNKHLYMSQIAVVENLSDSYNSVAHRPYLSGRESTFGCWLLSRRSVRRVRWRIRTV